MGRKLFAFTLAALFIYVASPLILPVVMGAMLAMLFTPWLERLESRGVSASLGSAVMTLGITGVILLPTAFLVFNAAKTAFVQLQSLRNAPAGGSTDMIDALFANPRM